MSYEGAWQHPLSPYWIDKNGNSLPLHAQPGGLTYRYWSDLIEGVDTDSNTRKPARVVEEFKTRLQRETEQFRLWVFGYDMDNMKPRNWYETVFPLYLFSNERRAKTFSMRIQAKIEASTMAASLVRSGVKEAWFRRPGDAKGDTSFIAEDFFARTEKGFFLSLEGLPEALAEENAVERILIDWHGTLCREALDLFDELANREDATFAEMKRVVAARQKLLRQLNGKKLRQTLNLPERKKEKRA
jgi:CRISPR system Cascade subunit CasA